VLPETVIVTDGWAGYDNVSLMNSGIYQHELHVLSTQNFVNDINPEIKQSIEGLWIQS